MKCPLPSVMLIKLVAGSHFILNWHGDHGNMRKKPVNGSMEFEIPLKLVGTRYSRVFFG